MTEPSSELAEIVVIKLGALGDIVRTSYLMATFAKVRNARLTWITRRSGVDLLRFNPHVHRVLTLEDDPLPQRADILLSLDDEFEAVSVAKLIEARERIGAFFESDGSIGYSDSARPWFDMGLISRFGKERADQLKKVNPRSHVELFSEILGIDGVRPVFYGDPSQEPIWRARRNGAAKVLGFNLFAGGRWPSKELRDVEAVNLVRAIGHCMAADGQPYKLVAFSDRTNLERSAELRSHIAGLEPWDTGESTLAFAAAVAACDYVVSTDSLGLHLAIAQQVPNLSFYAPTSAVEIDTFGRGVKVLSTSPDYCNYRRDADNRSLTAERIFGAWKAHAQELGLIRHD